MKNVKVCFSSMGFAKIYAPSIVEITSTFFSTAPDSDELRNDRTVKVTKKEMSELMSELAEYTQMLEEGYHSDEENGDAVEAIEDLINAQVL